MRQAGNKWNHLHAMPLGASKMDKPPTKDPTGGSTDKERMPPAGLDQRERNLLLA